MLIVIHLTLNPSPHVFIKEIENSMQDLLLYNLVTSPRGIKADTENSFKVRKTFQIKK